MIDASQRTIFISRAGAQKDIAIRVAAILRNAGYTTVLQDEDFGHTSFMAKMHDTLASGARVAALLSHDYLDSKNCSAEWQAALTGDPQNKEQRLVVFRVTDCAPTGLLKPIPYVNIEPAKNDPAMLAKLVRDAFPSIGQRSSRVMTAPTPLIDPDSIWDVPSFTGRGDALDALRKALFVDGVVASVTQPAAVHGMGGVGKSALAREYGWRNRNDYSFLWWLNAEKEEGVIDGLIGLGANSFPEIDKEQDRTKAARFVLLHAFSNLQKPALLVFDNVEDRALISKWRPHQNAHVVVTSRLHGWGGGIKAIEIEKWPPKEARDYLLKESGRVDIPSTDAARVAETLGHLPLALAHAAAYLRDNPAVTAEAYMARIEYHLNRVPIGSGYPNAVYATLQEAVEYAERRGPGAGAVLCLAAFCAPDDIPFELLEQRPEVYSRTLAPSFESVKAAALREAVDNQNSRDEALSALGSTSLISLNLDSRTFSIHRLVQAACRDLIRDDKEKWISSTLTVSDAAFPYVEFSNWPLCERLISHAESVAEHASDEIDAPLPRLLNQAGYYLKVRAEYSRAERLYRRGLVVREKTRTANHPDTATALNNLATLLYELERYADAEPLFRRALDINERTLGTDHPNVGTDCNNLASLLAETGRIEEAEQLYKRGLEIKEKVYGPDHPSVATSLINLGFIARTAKRFDEAQQLCERALAIDERSYGPNHPDVATDLHNLAVLAVDRNELDDALHIAERAVQIRLVSLGADHPHTRLSREIADEIRKKMHDS